MTEEQTDLQDTELLTESPADSEQPVDLAPADTEQAVDLAPAEDEPDALEEPAEGEGNDDHLVPGQTEVAVEPEVVIDDETMRRALEAILMVTDEPLPVLTLARTVGRPTGDISAALTSLAEEYTEQGRGFDLREVGGGWRYYTREDAAQYVERFVLDGQQSRLTQAALETLAVVAYKQPVSRARVSAVRGVNVDGVMRTLISRGLVEEAGADTESQAILYRTTSYFLERMGMQGLDDLPELAPYLPEMDDMEEELAAHAAPPADSDATPDAASENAAVDAGTDTDVSSDEAGDAATVQVGSDEGDPGQVEEELEPAEELEAGGDTEVEQEVDPAEIPEIDGDPEQADAATDADDDGDGDDSGNGSGDAAGAEEAGFEGADEGDDDADGEGAEGCGDDDFDEDDESEDERLEAAEDLEAAGGAAEVDADEPPAPTDDPTTAAPTDDASTDGSADVGTAGGGADGVAGAGDPAYGVNRGQGSGDVGSVGGSWSNRDDD